MGDEAEFLMKCMQQAKQEDDQRKEQERRDAEEFQKAIQGRTVSLASKKKKEAGVFGAGLQQMKERSAAGSVVAPAFKSSMNRGLFAKPDFNLKKRRRSSDAE